MDLLPIDLYGLILKRMDAVSGLAFALSFNRAKRGFLHHVKFSRCQDYIYFSSNVAELQLCLEYASQVCIRNVLEDMCRKGRVDMVACVLNSQKLEKEDLYCAFTDAYSIYGNAAIARMLIQAGVDPSYDNNLAIECASEYGLVEVVKVLLADPRVDPSVMNSSSLMGAVREKHSIIVRLLIAHPKITSVNDIIEAQREAKRQGCGDIVDCLRKWLRKRGR
jgi:hypothetical protein